MKWRFGGESTGGHCELLLRKTEPPLSLREIRHGLQKMLLRKIRPEHFGHVEFGIGYLPEEEVRHPLFAARSYEEVGVGYALSLKMHGEQRVVYVLGANPSGGGLFRDDSARLDYIGSAAVAQCQLKA